MILNDRVRVFPFLVCLSFLTLISFCVGSATSKKPNIVLIVADDLGFNDVPWHNKEVIAPHLQDLAQNGVVLEQSYVQPICSPTRSAIMTGRYPFTIGRQGDVIWPLMPTGLTLNSTILPQYLKSLGYSTHAIGKWHLGFCNWKYTPTERGFDTFHGYYTGSEDYFKHIRSYYKAGKEPQMESGGDSYRAKYSELNINSEPGVNFPINGYDFRRNRLPDLDSYGTYSSYLFASRVEEILKSSDSDSPKFIYLAFQSVHSPLEVPENYTEPYAYIQNRNRRTYLGMVTAMDEAVGRVVQALKTSGNYENSVIVFTTDNGGPTISGGNNWPLRGNKTTLWEGGTRGAAFIHSPLIKNNGRVSNNLIHATDWLSTFITLAGGTPPNGTNSVNQWEALNEEKPPPRNEMVYTANINENHGFQAAIRDGDYKLLVGYPGPGEWIPPPEVDVPRRIKTSKNSLTSLKGSSYSQMKDWTHKDHLRFVQKAKAKCRSWNCFKSILREYRKLAKSAAGETKEILSKIIKVIKSFADSFRKKLPNSDGYFSEQGLQGNLVNSVHSGRLKRGVNESAPGMPNFEQLQSLPLQLYNLKDDPEERKNLATPDSKIVATLLNRLLTYENRFVPADRPDDNPAGNPKYWSGIWSPGWC